MKDPLMRKLQAKRFLWFWIYTFFALIVPILLINYKYNLIVRVTQKPTVTELTISGMIALLIVLFYARHHIHQWIDEMEEGPTKTIYKEFWRTIPLFLLFFALKYAELHIKNYQWVVWWSACSNTVAVYPRIKHIQYRKYVRDIKLARRIKRASEQIN